MGQTWETGVPDTQFQTQAGNFLALNGGGAGSDGVDGARIVVG